MRREEWTDSVDSTLLKIVVKGDVMHAMEMKGLPDNVVSIGEGILGGRLPCTLEVHAVVEDIVAEVEILVPDGIGPEGAVHVVICVSTGDSCVWIRIRE